MLRSPEKMFIRYFITFTCLRLDDLVKLQFLILFFSNFSFLYLGTREGSCGKIKNFLGDF